MDLQLRNKVIVVCEGEDNISEAIVKVLAAEGAIPVLIGSKEHHHLKTVEAIKCGGGNCWHLTAELTKPEDCKKAIEQLLYKFGKIDGLINDSCFNENAALVDGNHETFITLLHKRFVHYYLLAHYALPALKISKGSILNINFKPTNPGVVGPPAYTTNNDAINALTREWAVELLHYNIRVNAIVIENRKHLYDKRIANFPDPEKLKENSSKISPEKWFATTEEIANMVAFLLSGRSSHTTGQLIHVDGSDVYLDQAMAGA